MKKKNRVTFLIITSTHGKQLRISLNRHLLSFFIVVFVLLLFSGIVGAWKYHENTVLKERTLMLETEKKHLEAISRTVLHINEKNSLIHGLLGLDDKKHHPAQDITDSDSVDQAD